MAEAGDRGPGEWKTDGKITEIDLRKARTGTDH